jgi:hypothetical protein
MLVNYSRVYAFLNSYNFHAKNTVKTLSLPLQTLRTGQTWQRERAKDDSIYGAPLSAGEAQMVLRFEVVSMFQVKKTSTIRHNQAQSVTCTFVCSQAQISLIYVVSFCIFVHMAFSFLKTYHNFMSHFQTRTYDLYFEMADKKIASKLQES